MFKRHIINPFHQVIKWIIISYSFVISVVIFALTISSLTKQGVNDSGLYLALLIGSSCVWMVELILSSFSVTQYLRGCLTIVYGLAGYKILLEVLKSDSTTAPADFAVFAMLPLIGIYLCYNWMTSGLSFLVGIGCYIVLTFFFEGKSASNL